MTEEEKKMTLERVKHWYLRAWCRVYRAGRNNLHKSAYVVLPGEEMTWRDRDLRGLAFWGFKSKRAQRLARLGFELSEDYPVFEDKEPVDDYALTEEAIEDNLYDRLGARYTKALARSMAHSKQVKAAAVLNNAFTAGASAGGDGVALAVNSLCFDPDGAMLAAGRANDSFTVHDMTGTAAGVNVFTHPKSAGH